MPTGRRRRSGQVGPRSTCRSARLLPPRPVHDVPVIEVGKRLCKARQVVNSHRQRRRIARSTGLGAGIQYETNRPAAPRTPRGRCRVGRVRWVRPSSRPWATARASMGTQGLRQRVERPASLTPRRPGGQRGATGPTCMGGQGKGSSQSGHPSAGLSTYALPQWGLVTPCMSAVALLGPRLAGYAGRRRLGPPSRSS